MACGYGRNDMIDEMGGGLDHPACAAGRAKSSVFARKCHQKFMSAAIAFDPQKTVFQPTAGEVIDKLLGDESRQLVDYLACVGYK